MKRLTMRSSTLIACVALYFTVVLNYPFYRTVLEAHPFTGASGDFFLFTVPLFIFFVLFAVFQIFAIPFLHKIIIPLMLVISAAISYNEIFLGVYFNTDMLENVLQTNAAEASKLIVLPYILWIIFYGKTLLHRLWQQPQRPSDADALPIGTDHRHIGSQGLRTAFQGQQNRLLPYGGKEVRRLSSCCCMGSHRRG